MRALYLLPAVFILGFNTPVPPTVVQVPFTVTDGGTTIVVTTQLLDAGVQQSKPLLNNNSASPMSIACNVQDAGTNGSQAGLYLLGSNTADAGQWVTLASQATPLTSGIVAFDPVSTGFPFIAIAVDAGGATTGSVSCTANLPLPTTGF